MISHDHRCIFVHIPKTAGNSVNRVFGVGWEDHKDLQRYFDETPREVFERYFKFAVVRNPWDRLLSDYNYQLKKSRAPSSKLFVFTADGSKRNFAEWVETALATPDGYEAGAWGGSVSPHIHRWSPQVDWISIDGEPRADFVARIERLPEDFRQICRRLNLPAVRLPHRNRRLHWHYSHYYDRTTRELVAAYYARDIEQFDYEFEHAFLRLAVNWPGARRHAESAREDAPDHQDNIGPGEACTVSFATARPPARKRIWQRRPGLAAATSLALLLGIFGAVSMGTPLAAADTWLPATVQRSVQSMIVRSGAPTAGNPVGRFFTHARRLRRAMTDLNLRLEVLPFAGPGTMVTLEAESPGAARAFAPTTAPVVSRSGSGPAPRWWLRRDRNNHDD